VPVRIVYDREVTYAAPRFDHEGVFDLIPENMNDVFARMHEGRIEGRVVLDLAARSSCRVNGCQSTFSPDIP
jgi:hypothetical protein